MEKEKTNDNQIKEVSESEVPQADATFEENGVEQPYCAPHGKLGLVLEGGGVKGAYHIGALKAFFENGYSFDGVAGTSIGALNAAMLVQGDFDELCKVWESVDVSDIMDMDSELIEKLAQGDVADKSFWLSLGRKVWKLDEFVKQNTERMHAFVRTHLDVDKIMDSPMDFGIVTYSVSERKPYELMKEDIPPEFMDEYIIASATFPVYNLMEINGKKFIDGGVYDNMPINLLARHGYRNFLAIRTSTKPPKRKLELPDLNVTYVVPSEDLGHAMMFTPENVKQFQKLGYYDAQRVIKGYQGTKFYFYPFDEKEFLDKLCDCPLGFYVSLFHTIGAVPSEVKAENVDKLLKIVKREQYLPAYTKDSVALLSLFENVGAILNMEKFVIYDEIDFVVSALEKLKPLAFDRAGFFETFRPLKSQVLTEILLAVAAFALK